MREQSSVALDLSRCFREAGEVYKQNLVVLVVAALLLDLLSTVTLLILLGPLAGGMSLLALRALRAKDQQAELNDLFSGFSKFLTLFGLFWLTFVPILIASVLVLPGLLLMTIWMFSFTLVMDRDAKLFESLAKSVEMVQAGGWGKCLLLTLVDFVLHMAPIFVPYVGCLLGWFITPLGWLIVASAYVQIIEAQKLPLSDEEAGAGDNAPAAG